MTGLNLLFLGMAMDQGEQGENMSFIGHLAELRKRIMWSIIPIIIFAGIIFYFFDVLSEVILMSMTKAEFPTYRLFCYISELSGFENSDFCKDIPIQVREDAVGQQFTISMWFSIVGGIIISIPWIIYQIWLFIKPALKPVELKAVRGFGLYVFLLLIMGVAFGYYIVAPLCINFFGNYDPLKIAKIPSFTSYYKFITNPVLACGILFQLPIVIYLMSKLGIITPAVLKKYRKHVIVIILIVSAIITPPDFVSQVIVSIPVLILYEISIFISARILKAHLKRQVG